MNTTDENESVTVTISPQPAKTFGEFDIVVCNNNPLHKRKKTWSIIYHAEGDYANEIASLRVLNVSRFLVIRKIELWVLRKLLKK